MDMVDRYLEAVAAQLSADEREDIVAELRDLILSRFEAREETLGRALTDEEKEAILREIGHPLVVAARYRKGPDSLIGPELFPYWMYAVKAGLLVLLAVHALLLLVTLVSGPPDASQAISQAVHHFVGAGVSLIGGLTLAGAVMEHYGVKPKWLTHWRVRDLPAFQLSDPGHWGAAASGGSNTRRACLRRKTQAAGATSEAVFSLLASALFVLWWVGLIHLPDITAMRIDGGTAILSPAPIWATLFVPVLVYALAQMGVDLFTLVRPEARRMRAVLSVLIAVPGLWLIYVILDAGHWFTLSVGAEQARIVGDWTLLSPARLGDIGDGPRNLERVAAMMSLVATWIVAISAVSLSWKIIAGVWRAMQPVVARGDDR